MPEITEASVEQEIQDKGLAAPRLKPADIDNCIADIAFHRFPGTTLTVCALTARNGFQVIGESACASPENFDEKIGRDLAFKKARDQLWALEGYLLRSKLAGHVRAVAVLAFACCCVGWAGIAIAQTAAPSTPDEWYQVVCGNNGAVIKWAAGAFATSWLASLLNGSVKLPAWLAAPLHLISGNLPALIQTLAGAPPAAPPAAPPPQAKKEV